MDTRLRLFVPALFGAIAIVLIALTPCAARANSDDEPPDVPEPVEVCLSCQAIAADEPVLEGPTLWGVIGRPVASAADRKAVLDFLETLVPGTEAAAAAE